METIQSIHEAAVQCAKSFKRAESAMLDILNKVNERKVFREMGYSSLHTYASQALKLSDAQAYQFIGVAKKVLEIPELKLAIDQGDLNVSTARRIVSILTPENQEEWIEKAKVLPQRKLEMEVVKANPKPEPRARIRPIAKERLEMKVGISEALEAKLRKIQDLVSQKTKRHCSIEEALDAMAEGFLEKNDPVRRAERLLVARTKKPAVTKPAEPPVAVGVRRPLPAATRNRVWLRDRGQCTYVTPHGRCTQTRWIDVHHVRPISEGGTDDLGNLTTLCSSHHRSTHSSFDSPASRLGALRASTYRAGFHP